MRSVLVSGDKLLLQRRGHPPANYYAIQPFISWMISDIFLDSVHYIWANKHFYPHNSLSPKSSNPYRIYSDLYEPSFVRDPYDKYIMQHRQNLSAGVGRSLTDRSHSSYFLKDEIVYICRAASPICFFPCVLLIPEDIATSKGRLAGSGLSGSTEVLLPDLEGKEFSIFFPDVNRLHELELLLSTLNSIMYDNIRTSIDKKIKVAEVMLDDYC